MLIDPVLANMLHNEAEYNRKKLKRKNSRKRQRALIVQLLIDFADNTTLHGLKYVIKRGISIAENIFWLLTFIISIGLCSYLISIVYLKWKTSPVIVSFSEKMEPVGNVPFPSITICPQIKSKTSVFNFTYYKHLFRKISKSEFSSNSTLINLKKEFTTVKLICSRSMKEKSSNNSEKYYKPKKNSHRFEAIHFLKKVSPKINEVFHTCVWRRNDVPCEDIFKEVLTSEGVCFNFNALSSKEIFFEDIIQRDYNYSEVTQESIGWTVDNGYIDKSIDTYPRRGLENGGVPDLFLTLKEDTRERDALCNGINHGFKIYVQNPADMPQETLYYYAALPDQISSLALKFSKVSSSEDLAEYSSDVRQCFFPKDRQLKYFRIYTPHNCRLECAANYTLKKCGCLWFDLPYHDSNYICTAGQLGCVSEARGDLAAKEINSSIGLKSRACNCLPNCNSVTYDAEILKTQFDYTSYAKAYSTNFNQVDGNYKPSAVEIYFKEPQFVSIRRSELFGLTDFLANIGGLLGLFLGFSFLSLVEIIYFVSLRLCCLLRKDLAQFEDTDET